MKKLIKRISAVLLSILVLLSSMSIPTISTVMADEDTSEPVTEYVDESAEPEAPIEETLPVDPGYTDTQDSFDAPAEAVESYEDTTEAQTETTEEATEEETTEDGKPELNKESLPFSGSAYGVDVRVTADPGTFPVGTIMTVVGVSSAEVYETVNNAVEGEVAEVRTVDITFYGPDGVEVQPEIPVHMILSAPGLDASAKKEVVHIADDGQTDVISGATISGNNASLDAGSFSKYSILTLAQDTEDAASENTEEEKTRGGDGAKDGNAETWMVTFYDRDAQVYETIAVEKGQAIGTLPATVAREDYDAFWAIGKIVEGTQGPETKVTGDRIDATWVPTADTTIVPDYDQIIYTIKFYEEDKTTLVDTKTVTSRTSYCLNDIPKVPDKDGFTGKWVCKVGDFGNTVAANTEGLATDRVVDVWAEYDQNVFTVTFKVNGDTYSTGKFYKGDKLSFPADPTLSGKAFNGWYDNDGNKYEGNDISVVSDLVLTAGFTDKAKVTFIVYGDDGVTPIDSLTQYFEVVEGQTIGNMPQNPFVSGKVFEKWVNKDTGEEVTADTVVGENGITAVAVFRTVAVYNITAEYYYLNDRGGEVLFNTDLLQVEEHELPYTITAPATTQTDPTQVSTGAIYYPETPIVEVKLADFDTDHNATVRIKYVPYTAEYDFVYMLKDLEGDEYTEIDRVQGVKGVLNSYVTPTVKNYDYAVLELAEGDNITQAEGQELYVYYTRKNFTLTYQTNGGSYVTGGTYPYGSTATVTSTVPTRTGYTFAGWYLDEALTQAAGSSVIIEDNTTLYAKWEGTSVHYTIVYMFEKFNDAGTQSSYVYDNSRNGTGTVGSTVQASSAPAISRTGWEADTAKNATSSVVIEADGSSVLYVYYKLKEYTFYYQPGNYGNYYNVTAKLNNESKTGNNNYSYYLTVKLGQDISSTWPTSLTDAYFTYYGTTYNPIFGGWIYENTVYVTKRLTVTEDMLPSSGNSIIYPAYWLLQSNTYAVNYWLQNADDDEYAVSEQYSQTYASNTDGLSPKDISGYSQHNGDASAPQGYAGTTVSISSVVQNNNGAYVRDDNKTRPNATYYEYNGHYYRQRVSGYGGDGNQFTRYNVTFITTYNFYYDRDTYTIDYFYGSEKLNTINYVKFNANINKSPYVWTPTASQCGVDSDYTFAGWYSDAGLTASYTFSTMPASNLVLYAKWDAPTYTVSFVDGDDPSTQLADSQTVEKYKKVSAPESTPSKDGYTFDGWYTSADGNELFDWNTQITVDTTVYAHWTRNTLSFTVHYVDEDGNSVADDKVVSNPNYVVGQTITEQAIAVAGYKPQKNSLSLELSSNISENIITFVYSEKSGKTKYTVKYIINPEEYPGNIPIADEITVEKPGDTASVIELAESVDYTALYAAHPELNGVQFYPDEVEKTLVLAANEEENVLIFYYSSFKNTKVTVHFVDMDGVAIPNTDTDVSTLKVGQTYTLARSPIVGWELYSATEGSPDGDPDENPAGTSYDITEATCQQGNLEFTLFYRKKATITVNSFSKQYDGTALTLPEGLNDQVTVEGLLDGHKLTALDYMYVNADYPDSAPYGRLNAGTARVVPTNAVITKSGTPVSEKYYYVRYISGTLTVSKINVTVRIEPDRWTGAIYTGEEYKAGFTNSSKTVDDYIMISHDGYKTSYRDTIWNTVKNKTTPGGAGLGYYGIAKTDAGDYTYDLDLTLADLPDDSNYSVSLFVREGRLQILPRQVTVTTEPAEKAYDGTPLTNPDASISQQQSDSDKTGIITADKNKVTVTANGTITDPGSTDNTYEITWGGVNPENYRIIDSLGKLTVSPGALIITIKNKSVAYSGAEQFGYEFPESVTGTGTKIETEEYIIEGLGEGQVLTITGYGVPSGTLVGTYYGSMDNATVTVMAGETDVTGYYEVTKTPGQLIITDEEIDPALVVTKNHTAKTGEEGEEVADTYKEGETVTFNISVKNIYNEGKTITLTEIEGVTLAQSTFENVAAGETVQTTATYTIKAADMAAGSFTNMVTAKFSDLDKTWQASDTVDAEEINASIEVTKTSDNTAVKVGDTVTYTITVKNTGNATVSGLALNDVLAGITLGALDKTTIAPNETATAQATYVVQQKDVDAGKIDNTVTATGKDPKNENVTGTASETVTTDTAAPKLKVTKSANPSSGVAVGTPIEYTVTVENTGNVTVKGITLTDDKMAEADKPAAFDLAPADAARSFTYTYIVTQADVDAGEINNTVTAAGTDPFNTPVSDSATAKVTTVEPVAALTVTKTADNTTKQYAVGDIVNYSVTVKNSGNVTISGIILEDEKMAEADVPEAFDLAPGDEPKTIIYKYTVTQADIDAGTINNTATATGKDPKNNTVTAEASLTLNTVDAAAQLTITKKADKTTNVKVDDVITYTVVVTNSGNVTVKDIALSDTLVTPTGTNAETFDLAPNGTKEFTYTYTVAQKDVDAGTITNTASAKGKNPKGADVNSNDVTVSVTTVAAEPALTVTKTADKTENVKVGDRITYTVVVKNTGNVTVSNIALSDTLVTLSEVLSEDELAAFELAPNAEKEFIYTYTVKQTDVDAGKIKNIVTANGKDPKGDDVTPATATVTVTTVGAEPALTVNKTAAPTTGVKVGDKVTYTVVITNSGNVTVKGIKVTDPLWGTADDQTAFDLAPEGTKTITYTYSVKQSDVDAGKIDNTATAIGKDPSGENVTASDDATVTTVVAEPAIEVTKVSDRTSGVKVGDIINYTVVVKNNGNVTLNATLSDALGGLNNIQIPGLAPSAEKEFTYSYTVKQEDVDAGKIDNTAAAEGTAPNNQKVNDSKTVTVTTEEAKAELTVEKNADKDSGVKVGETIHYTVTVTNSGNVTVKGVTIEDNLVTDTGAQTVDLAPGELTSIGYDYKVLQADVDAGKIDNTATATGKDPKNNNVTGSDSVTVNTVEADPSLDVTKTATPVLPEGKDKVGVGDTVNYKVVVKNNGNVTVSGIELVDTKVTLTEAAFALAPNEIKEITYTYTVTQADVDAGTIVNIATATGKAPNGSNVTDDATATVPTEEAKPELKVEKTPNPTSGVAVNDKITYTVVVTNSGNVTISGITLADALMAEDAAPEAFDLAPGDDPKTITYEYTVTQADVDAGKIDNRATATGNDPNGASVTAYGEATVTTVEAELEIAVTKTAAYDNSDTEKPGVGTIITYTIIVENKGNVTVSGINLVDEMMPAESVPEAFTLAPAATNTITYTYEVTQADVDAGKIVNTATATGKDPSGEDVTDDDTATVNTVEPDAKLTVVKTADPTSEVKVGNKVTYTVDVTNSGNVTVKDIVLTDTLVTLTDAQKAIGTLAPNGTKQITYEYTVTQEDVDAGKIENTATANGKDPKNTDVTASDDATVTTVAAAPSLKVEKTADKASGYKVGDTVNYSVKVTNTGNVTISGIKLEDTLVTISEDAFELSPGETMPLNYTYEVTQADVDAGKIDNTATATGKAPSGAEITNNASYTVTTVDPEPELTVEKTASPSSGVKVDEKVVYTVVVTNTGNVTVKDIVLSDTLVTLTDEQKAIGTLAPAETKTITYKYTVTQADVDAGEIKNTATATGKDPKNNDVTASDDAEVTTVEADAELTVEKTASPTSGVKVGDKVTYTVVVTNSGNVTVKGIELEDAKMAAEDAPETFDLAPGDAPKTITYEYTVTQADVDAGKIDNTATATGKDPKNNEVTASDDAEVTTVEADAELTVEKTANISSGVGVGDEVTYTVVVTNSGNVTVSGITLADAKMPSNAAPEAFELAPAGTKTISYKYKVTQADVDAGKIDNTATATGKDPKGNEVKKSDDATVTTVTAAPALTVEKTASPSTNVKVGDTVNYTVVVTNSGNVTVSDIKLSDTLVTLTNDQKAVGTLAPEGTKTITYTYTVKQSDVDAGKIDNTATATGKDPKNGEVKGSDDATVTTVAANPELTVSKTSDKVKDDGTPIPVKVGDEVTYTVTVTNSGNVTVTGIGFEDTLVELSEEAFDLAPAGTKTITYTYTVTQDDVDKGQINNNVTAKGKDPSNKDVSGTANAEVKAVDADASLKVTKTADKTENVAVDDVITYTVSVKNTGNVTVKGIKLEDTKMAATAVPDTFDLAPGISKTNITYTYKVTQEDVDAGLIQNIVTATGKDPKNNDVTGSDSKTVTAVEANAKLKVTKTADPKENVKVGDKVEYTVKVENTGNVTISGITLEDALMAAADAPTAFNLAPAGTKTITYEYTVTQADVDAGKIDNTATATGKDPKQNDVSDNAEATVTTVEADASIEVTKKASKTSNAAVNDVITYTVTVENTGNVTVKGITLRDTLVTLNEQAFDLAPGDDPKTVTYEYTVRQSDVDAGKIDNTVTATGKDPKNNEVADYAEVTVTAVKANAELEITKTASKTSNAVVNDVITYTVTVENKGNVTVKDITLSDTLVTLNEEAFDLAPGVKKNDITYTYTVKQSDVDAGKIDNTVTATGKDPKNENVSDEASVTVTAVEAKPELTVTKSADMTSNVEVGDEVEYTVTVKNTGNVTISELSLEDTLVDLSEDSINTMDPPMNLGPKEQFTLSYKYTVTQADVDAGEIKNTATAKGKDPKGKPVTDSDDETVTTVEAAAELTVEKTADPTDGVIVGDTINYIIVVTNSGNVTVKGIELTDALEGFVFDKDATTKNIKLAPGEKATAKGTYTVTQADVDAGEIKNTATATGKDPKDKEVTASDDATVTTVTATPALSVTKTADPTTGVKVDDKINYTVVVTNSGNVTVKDIVLEDTLVTLTDVQKAIGTLAPEGTKTINYEYTVTQADVDAGKIDNEAIATGKDPKDKEVTASDDAAVTTVAARPSISVTKTSDNEKVAVGDTVTYTVVVKNTGNVTVTGITLADVLMSEADKPEAFDLAPNAEKTITYTYTVTQADVDAGQIDNTVTATGKDPKNEDVTDEDTCTVTAEDADAQLSVTKTADPTENVKVGDKVNYTVVVTNSGNVTISGIALEDTLVTVEEEAFNLAPAGTKTITYEYTVTQDDVDAGEINNTATATGTDPKGNPVEKSASAKVTTVAPAPELTVEKTADPNKDVKVGDKVTYTVVVTNSGNVTVKDIVLADTLVTLTDAQKAIGTLAPAGTKTISYEYTVTQADVDAGEIKNTATAKGKDPKDKDVTKSASVTVKTEEAKPTLSVKKKANKTTIDKAGDKIPYEVVVENTGNVTLSGITLSDTLVTLTDEQKAIGTLAPGDSKKISYEYTVLQSDIDAGKVENTATAEGKSPKDQTATGTQTVEVKAKQNGHLTVEKTITSNTPDDGYALGDEIKYEVKVTNDGNLTISNVEVTDELTSAKWSVTSMAPGATRTFETSYTVKEADILEGKVINEATVSGTSPDPDNPKVPSTPGRVEAKAEKAKPVLELIKTAENNSYVYGETVHYTIVVKNTGNLTIKDIAVTDELTGTITPAGAFTLKPGEEKTLTADYKVKPADAKKGSLKNTAEASGTASNNKNIKAEGDVTVTTKQIKITITALGDEKIYDGDPLTKDGIVTATPDGILNGDYVQSCTVTGSQTDAGSSDNTPSDAVIVNADNETVTDGYAITYKPGTLTVNPADIEDDPDERFNVADPSNTVYNGADQRQPVTITDTVTGKTLVEGKDFTLTYSPDVRNVGIVTVTITGIGNYKGSITRTYQITPASVTVTAANATKVEGTADPTFTATVSGLVGGDTAALINYTLTRVTGEAVGTYTITPSGAALQGNYTVTYVPGTLMITATAPIIPVVIPGAPVVVPPVVVPDDPTPRTDPVPEPTTEEIIDPEPPLVNNDQWALINLLCAIASAILSIVMIITFAVGKKEDEDEDEQNQNEDGESKKARNGLKFLGLIPGIGGIIAFILTETIAGKMVLTDKWTILMAVIAVISIVLTIVIKNKPNNNADEDQEA